jgi:hypothetical protein
MLFAEYNTDVARGFVPAELPYDGNRKGSDAMIALNGYYDGKNIIPLDHGKALRKNQRVIITVLDEKPEGDGGELQTILKLIDETAGMLKI